MALKTLDRDNRFQSTLIKPRVSFDVDLDLSEVMDSVKENDPLPIVELKPFVQKVWRREKSFATSLDRCSSVNTVKSEKSNTSRAENRNHDTDVVSQISPEGLTDGGVTISPPPKTSHSLPPRLSERFLTFYVSTFDDFKSQNEHLNKFVGETGFRPKSRLHPVVDPKSRKQIEYSESIIPGFITRDDRTKTTLDEISDGESISRMYSCSPKAIGPEGIQKQQQIRISGENIDQTKDRQSKLSSPAPSKILTGSWHGTSVRHGSPASMLYHSKSKNNLPRAKTPLYDHLDRTGILPSLSINATSLKSKQARKLDDAHSEDYADYRDTFEAELKPNIGGIENSFVVLSKHGSPTKLERQLSFELQKNLSRFRKLKDYSPFEINPAELAKYYPPPTFNMTQGEESIKRALASNAFKKRKGTKGKDNFRKLVRGRIISEHSHAHSRQSVKKISLDQEHFDSYVNDYEQFHKVSETPFPEDEPSVPFDTPRSVTESGKISIATETQALDNKVDSKQICDKIESNETVDHDDHANRTKVSANVKVTTENKKAEVVKNNAKAKLAKPPTHKAKRQNKPAFEVQAVKMGPSSDQETVDAVGRTFITSDNMAQVTEVTS